jgi:hypothetical protein
LDFRYNGKGNETMNRKKWLTFFFFILLLSDRLLAQSRKDESIEGIYLGGAASPIGILVEKLPNGNYIFTYITKMPDGEIRRSEWKSAYVLENHDSTYFFYWHLGREEPDDPTSNYILVYSVTIDERRMTGVRFFPYASEIRYEPVRLEKQRG